MRGTLLGVQRIQFSNNEGQAIIGNNIFVAFKDENVEGLRTERFFLKEGITLPKGIKLNDAIEISFNYKGKIEQVSAAN